MSKLCVILVALAIVHIVVSADYGPNMALTECKPCDEFCKPEDAPVCGNDCEYQGGLYWTCQTGYVRVSTDIGKGCVQPKNCPT